MAHPEIVRQSPCFVWFTLSNKPEFECVMDKKDYFEMVHNTTHWYIHISTKAKTEKPYIRSAGDGTCHHFHLHREILGMDRKFDFRWVGDHMNGDSLDNRRSNLRITTVHENARNGRKPAVPYRGAGIIWIESKKRFQAYTGTKFMGSGKHIDIVKAKIDSKLDGVA